MKPTLPAPVQPRPPEMRVPFSSGYDGDKMMRCTSSFRRDERLGPCPFCGSEARLWVNCQTVVGVACLGCAALMPTADQPAVEAWNRRAK